MNEAKSYRISKQEVWKAYERVKANKGAAGVDEESIEDFDKRLKDNLYKIWNRMSSGSYFPPPVRSVEIDKEGGREKEAGHTNCFGSDSTDGGEVKVRAGGGPPVCSGFLRISSEEIGAGGSGASPAAMLGTRLGHRPRHQRLF